MTEGTNYEGDCIHPGTAQCLYRTGQHGEPRDCVSATVRRSCKQAPELAEQADHDRRNDEAAAKWDAQADARAATAANIPTDLNWCSVCHKDIDGDTWLSDDTRDGRHFCYDCAPKDGIRLKDTIQPQAEAHR